MLPELVWRWEEGDEPEERRGEWGVRWEAERMECRDACSDWVKSRGWITVGDYNINKDELSAPFH